MENYSEKSSGSPSLVNFEWEIYQKSRVTIKGAEGPKQGITYYTTIISKRFTHQTIYDYRFTSLPLLKFLNLDM